MKNMTIEQFTMQTASNEPVPGGGSISARAGALAAALTEMVAGLTIGKKKYVEVEEEMKVAVEPMHKICEQLLVDIKRDSESFDLYMQALTLPKETEEEKAARTKAMQDGLKAANAYFLCHFFIIKVIQIVFFGICFNLFIPLIIPVREQAG